METSFEDDEAQEYPSEPKGDYISGAWARGQYTPATIIFEFKKPPKTLQAIVMWLNGLLQRKCSRSKHLPVGKVEIAVIMAAQLVEPTVDRGLAPENAPLVRRAGHLPQLPLLSLER